MHAISWVFRCLRQHIQPVVTQATRKLSNCRTSEICILPAGNVFFLLSLAGLGGQREKWCREIAKMLRLYLQVSAVPQRESCRSCKNFPAKAWCCVTRCERPVAGGRAKAKPRRQAGGPIQTFGGICRTCDETTKKRSEEQKVELQ